MSDVKAMLESIAREYPEPLIAGQFEVIDKITFEIETIRAYCGDKVTVCDLGGGLNVFTPGCAAMGWRAILVDDCNDAIHKQWGERVYAIHRAKGVELIRRDFIEQGLDFPPDSLDAVTIFDSMEHWHNSPKLLFHSIMKMLRPGGFFFLGGPNCVNLRKRITVPFGYGRWSSLDDWYEAPRMRGHVREPDMGDLLYIARDMGLADVRILGRNWMARNSPNKVTRLLARTFDNLIRLRPTLCSDIYLLGKRPA